MAQGVHKIDKEKFYHAYDEWSKGHMSLAKAAEYVGICDKTLKKYFWVLMTDGDFPDTLF